jgi:hypothetical protein
MSVTVGRLFAGSFNKKGLALDINQAARCSNWIFSRPFQKFVGLVIYCIPLNMFRLTLWIRVVTICTTCCNTRKLYILSTQCIYVFWTILKTNASFSLFPVMESRCVFHEVGTEFLLSALINFTLQNVKFCLLNFLWILCHPPLRPLLGSNIFCHVLFLKGHIAHSGSSRFELILKHKPSKKIKKSLVGGSCSKYWENRGA